MSIQAIGVSDALARLSFSALKCPLKVVNDVNSNKNKHSMKTTTSPPSTPIKTYETKMSSETLKIHSSQSPACTALNQKNAVGIIGGVSVLSTLIFLEKLVWWSSRGGGESVPFIVCSEPLPNFESCMYSGLDQNRVIVDNLRTKRVFLEEGGAQCIIMPCHFCHAWYGEISQGCKLPFLNIAECVALELKKARFKPLETGSGVKIGLIATHNVLMAGFYQEKLQNQGFEVVVPDNATMDHIINPAIKCLTRKDKEGACNLLRIAIQLLLIRAVNTVILASEELQGLLPYDDPLSKICIDPMDSMATSVVTWAKSAMLH